MPAAFLDAGVLQRVPPSVARLELTLDLGAGLQPSLVRVSPVNQTTAGRAPLILEHFLSKQVVPPLHYLASLLRHSAKVALDPAAWMAWNYTEALARSEAESTEPPLD